MFEILNALVRSLNSLRDRSVLLRLTIPALVAFLVWLLLAIFAHDALVAQLLALPPLSWLSGWEIRWPAEVMAWTGAWLAIFALAYIVAMLLAGIFIVPLLASRIGEREYPDVARAGEDGILESSVKSLVALVLFLLGWVCTLPLWLIPGMGLVLPVYWLAWLNRRTLAYDALAEHASREEWAVFLRRHGGRLLWLGALMGLMAYVPFLGLFAPALGSLMYIHYGLEALRRERQDNVVVIEGEARRL